MAFTKKQIDLAMKLSKERHMKSPKESIQEAITFVKDNLIACSKELIEQSYTGLLKENGVVLRVVAILQFDGNYPYAHKMAQDIIKQQALLYISKCLSLNHRQLYDI